VPGNFAAISFDWWAMRCQDCRVALSAVIDGEDPSVSQESLARHLGGCADCRRWREQAIDVTRAARLSVVGDAPDRTVPLLTALAAHRHRREAWAGRRGWLRAALVVTGVVLALVSAQGVLAEHPVMHADHHPAHEVGSFEVALAAGFLFAAWRPSRAWGMLPLAGPVVGLMTLTGGLDLAAGRTTASAEAGHLLLLFGLACMWGLSRPASGTGRQVLQRA